MTCSSLLADIALEGVRGIPRQTLIDKHRNRITWLLDHLVQLNLVHYVNSVYRANTHLGFYPRANSMIYQGGKL